MIADDAPGAVAALVIAIPSEATAVSKFAPGAEATVVLNRVESGESITRVPAPLTVAVEFRPDKPVRFAEARSVESKVLVRVARVPVETVPASGQATEGRV